MDFKSYFHNTYQGGESFINEVIIPIFGENKYEDAYEEDMLESNPELENMAANTGISQIIRLGTIDIPMNPTDVFDITVNDHVQMERNRVAIQLLVRRIMSTYSSAFMIFHYDDTTKWDWRFTFCSKQGKNSDMTDSKRYTFLLGPNQSCRTAAENFMTLFKKRGDIEIDDIIKAFDVEALSKEFFTKYKEQYEKFCNYLYDNKYDHAKFGIEFSQWGEKSIRDYVKKLLGRIVFLHFLQKKGWMGVPADKDWGEGDQQFMKSLFDNATNAQKANYLDEILEPLFTEALDTDRTDNDDLYDTRVEGFRNVKIPYLNGGLFERDVLDEPKSVFPSNYFEDLFNFFYQYNFTIDENDPNDAQVGVDPEMLGRIFENLLEDNKDKGAFYTPKEIVQYMCRESLIAYLQTDITDEGTKKSVRKFVSTYDMAELGCNEFAAIIDKKLKDVKICDPAIGSGAFPMGLLKELFLCRGAIEMFTDAAEIKKHIIQQNIYGVDIEKGAVDIARLRFWLSLIVDERTPHALPNMDFKIMQGNSLLEECKGVDLSQLIAKKTQKGKYVQMTFYEDDVDLLRKQLRAQMTQYYSCADHRIRSLMRASITNTIQQQISAKNIEIDLCNIDILGNSEFFLWHTWFADVFEKGGFDIIIGNPPYIKEDFNSDAFSVFKEASPYYMGKMDLWYGFACHGIDMLSNKGVLALIAQNNWTTSAGAKIMRNKVVSDTQILQMIDFNDYMVFGESAKIQTMIMIFKKNSTFDRYIIDYRKLHKNADKNDMISLLNKNENVCCEYLAPIFERSSHYNRYLTFNIQDQLLDKIALQPERLTEKEATNGIHPHYDFVNNKIHQKHPETVIGEGIFGLSHKEKEDMNLSSHELSLVKPYFTSEQVKRYYTDPQNDLWIIYTDSKFKKPSSMDEYPNIKSHLDKFKGIITSDNKPYGLHRARKEDFFKDEKIAVLRKCVGKPSFSYSNFDCYLSATFYVIQTKRWNMKFLTGLLNSRLIAFWLKGRGKMQGENYQLDKEPLLNIPLPIPSCNQRSIIDIVNRILSSKKANPLSDTSSLEAEIDRLVYELYGLTEEEIAIVEGTNS